MIREPKPFEEKQETNDAIASGFVSPTRDRGVFEFPLQKDQAGTDFVAPEQTQEDFEQRTPREGVDNFISDKFDGKVDINIDIDYDPINYSLDTIGGKFNIFSKVSLENRYNYLSKYELRLQEKNITATMQETELPNYYAFLALSGDKKINVPGEFYNFFTSNTTLHEMRLQISNARRLMFSANSCEYFLTYTQDIYDIPFYKYISIKTEKSGGMVNFLKQINVLDDFIASYEPVPALGESGILHIKKMDIDDKVSNKNTIYQKILQKKYELYKKSLQNGYRETMAYKIEKFLDNQLLQTYYIPNVKELEKINFYDTQVLYNKAYSYKIYRLDVIKKEDEFFKESIKIFDDSNAPSKIISKPPLPPMAELFSYGNRDDAIKIILSATSGRFLLEPVVTGRVKGSLDTELRKISDIRDSQKIPTGPIEYSNDDFLVGCHMYYSDMAPEDWNSFKKIKLQNSAFLPGNKKEIQFFLEPNKEHYICFQVTDFHGNISNPTHIYKIFIDNTDGNVQHFYESHEFSYYFEKKYKIEKSKKCRRFIYIQPSASQKYYDITTGELGGVSPSVWSKPLKMRLISSHTGRKIDIHFTFKKTRREKQKQQLFIV